MSPAHPKAPVATRAPAAHLLLRVLLGSGCLPELGVFGGAVQDPRRPLHKVAGEGDFDLGVFDSGSNCRWREVTLLSEPQPQQSQQEPKSRLSRTCPFVVYPNAAKEQVGK